jgi:hypothetical protein
MLITIPEFPGFCGSGLEAMLDGAETQFIEHHVDECDGDEAEFPPEIRLDAEAYCDALWKTNRTRGVYPEICRDFLLSYCDELRGIGIDVSLDFESIWSPREYNFETDRLFATISDADVARLVAISATDSHATLQGVWRERFTPRSGFVPHYDADEIDEMLSRAPADIDHNEASALLTAAIRVSGGDEIRLAHAAADDLWCEAHAYFEAAVDWAAFEHLIDEARADLLWSLDPETRATVSPDGAIPPPRCRQTLDLFAAR